MHPDAKNLRDPGEPLEGLRKIKAPHDEPQVGVPTVEPAAKARNPKLKTIDTYDDGSRHMP